MVFRVFPFDLGFRLPFRHRSPWFPALDVHDLDVGACLAWQRGRGLDQRNRSPVGLLRCSGQKENGVALVDGAGEKKSLDIHGAIRYGYHNRMK